MDRSASNRRWRRWLPGIGALSAALFLCVYVGLRMPVGRVPSFERVRSDHTKSDALLRDRHGALIHELRVNFRERSLDWLPLDDISPSLRAAVIASEDRRFYRHGGVDLLALFHAAADYLLSRDTRGASTITMQLAPQLRRGLRSDTGRRSLPDKWRQMRFAWALEKAWSKAEILETYLNLITFRGELKGISAASRGLFGKDPGGLDTVESLILAALIRSPNAGPDTVAKRAQKLASSVNGPSSPDAIATETRETLLRPYVVRQQVSLAPHVAYQLLKPGRRTDVTTSLDKGLQEFVRGLIIEHLRAVKSQNVSDGAALVVDNGTGEILAYVGNSGPESSAAYIDGVRARRQAGSTLKPFLYALAIDKRVIGAASLISDTPLDVPTERGIYRPENYDKGYKGLVPVRIALASSLNVPAVRVLMLVGPDGFVRKLGELGFGDLRDGEYYGYALALGSMETSLFELTNAYRALANGGVRGDMTLLPGQGNGRRMRVFSRQAAFVVSDILSDREARSVTFGLENPLVTRFWAAAKTGTSKDMRDNWCVGFSNRYTVGVWVGNFSGAAMWDVSGVTGAAPIWQEIMAYLHQREKSIQPSPPPGVSAIKVTRGEESGSGDEWFLAGMEPAPVQVRPAIHVGNRIAYPPQDAVFAVDPDIPAANQRIFFEASGSGKDLRWLLNGEVIGSGNLCGWNPAGGRFMLRLADSGDNTLDEVAFTVRE